MNLGCAQDTFSIAVLVHRVVAGAVIVVVGESGGVCIAEGRTWRVSGGNVRALRVSVRVRCGTVESLALTNELKKKCAL